MGVCLCWANEYLDGGSETEYMEVEGHCRHTHLLILHTQTENNVSRKLYQFLLNEKAGASN